MSCKRLAYLQSLLEGGPLEVHHDQQVHVAVRSRVAARVRAEQDHLLWMELRTIRLTMRSICTRVGVLFAIRGMIDLVNS